MAFDHGCVVEAALLRVENLPLADNGGGTQPAGAADILRRVSTAAWKSPKRAR